MTMWYIYLGATLVCAVVLIVTWAWRRIVDWLVRLEDAMRASEEGEDEEW